MVDFRALGLIGFRLTSVPEGIEGFIAAAVEVEAALRSVKVRAVENHQPGRIAVAAAKGVSAVIRCLLIADGFYHDRPVHQLDVDLDAGLLQGGLPQGEEVVLLTAGAQGGERQGHTVLLIVAVIAHDVAVSFQNALCLVMILGVGIGGLVRSPVSIHEHGVGAFAVIAENSLRNGLRRVGVQDGAAYFHIRKRTLDEVRVERIVTAGTDIRLGVVHERQRFYVLNWRLKHIDFAIHIGVDECRCAFSKAENHGVNLRRFACPGFVLDELDVFAVFPSDELVRAVCHGMFREIGLCPVAEGNAGQHMLR